MTQPLPHPDPLRESDAQAPVATPPRWLGLALGALVVMMTTGLMMVWWWGHRPGPPLPVIAELPAFHLVDRDGGAVDKGTLAGRPWVVDLIFTQCQIYCPRMTERMAALGPQLAPGVRRVSVSVDPTHDTPAALTAYARQHGAIDRDWLFLTGDEREVRRFAIEGLKLGVVTTPADDPRAAQEAITHSTKLVLVDGRGRVRGYYDAFDDGAIGRLARDAERLARGGDA